MPYLFRHLPTCPTSSLMPSPLTSSNPGKLLIWFFEPTCYSLPLGLSTYSSLQLVSPFIYFISMQVTHFLKLSLRFSASCFPSSEASQFLCIFSWYFIYSTKIYYAFNIMPFAVSVADVQTWIDIYLEGLPTFLLPCLFVPLSALKCWRAWNGS